MKKTILTSLILLSSTLNALTLSSPAFKQNAVIPNQFTYALDNQCNGDNLSPPLIIQDIPQKTQSLALTLIDPDGGNWLHWKAWNIAPNTAKIQTNASNNAEFEQANNDFETVGYGGPCPPTANHRYSFKLYALNKRFSSQPSLVQLQNATIETAELVGLRSPTDNKQWIEKNTDEDRLFNWAESKFSDQLAPPSSLSLQVVGYYFRYYSQTQSYLGIKDNTVYYLDSDNNLIDVGSIKQFLPSVTQDGF